MPEFEFPTPMTANPFATYVVAADAAARADAEGPTTSDDNPREFGGWMAVAIAAFALIARVVQGSSA
jgi:hypothetical protein